MKLVYSSELSAAPDPQRGSLLANPLALARLGSSMRWLYQEILNEPLPESLRLFVAQLEERERAGKGGGGRVARLERNSNSIPTGSSTNNMLRPFSNTSGQSGGAA